MTPDEILSYPPRVLSQARREAYFEKGFVSVQEIVPSDILKELQATTQGFVSKSREVRESDERFDIGPGHSAQTPVLRRLKSPDTASDIYWNFSTGLMAEVAADLVGPNVVFHHSKLNFKWYDESDTVKWHQDIQFFPHTNYNVLTIGCYLKTPQWKMAPRGFGRSHNGDLYNQYDENGAWTGMLSDQDALN